MINTGVITTGECVQFIEDQYGYGHPEAVRVVAIALEYGLKASACDHGFFEVRASRKWPGWVILTDREREPTERVARSVPVRYSSAPNRSATNTRRETAMARGQRAAAAAKPARARRAAPDPEPDEEAKDYTAYADKDPTPTMEDFADWLIAEVFEDNLEDLDEDSFREGVRLGGTLRMEFQASEFNQTRRAERAAEREDAAAAKSKPEAAKPARRGKAATEPEPEDLEDEAGDEDLEEEVEETKPARGRGRTAAKPAAAKPTARRGAPAPPGKPPARQADRPARGRGRSRSTDEAPY
jgi:hypothetical protein